MYSKLVGTSSYKYYSYYIASYVHNALLVRTGKPASIILLHLPNYLAYCGVCIQNHFSNYKLNPALYGHTIVHVYSHVTDYIAWYVLDCFSRMYKCA